MEGRKRLALLAVLLAWLGAGVPLTSVVPLVEPGDGEESAAGSVTAEEWTSVLSLARSRTHPLRITLRHAPGIPCSAAVALTLATQAPVSIRLLIHRFNE